jgi:hypothetical protein
LFWLAFLFLFWLRKKKGLPGQRGLFFLKILFAQATGLFIFGLIQKRSEKLKPACRQAGLHENWLKTHP